MGELFFLGSAHKSSLILGFLLLGSRHNKDTSLSLSLVNRASIDAPNPELIELSVSHLSPDLQRTATMLKNLKTKLDNPHEWITADTTPGIMLFGVTLVVWFAIFLTANTIAYFVG